ncbi:MAG TPA: DUF4164 family protein [Candidatus Cybelea sp.]|nr:DUF4164 family protein [Candidatus Cybelea sp.]
MSDAEQMQERLERALARIEASVARTPQNTAQAAAIKLENRTLKDERERLGKTLADLQAENTALRTTSDAVAGRLDRAIDRLRALLAAG